MEGVGAASINVVFQAVVVMSESLFIIQGLLKEMRPSIRDSDKAL